MNEELLLAAEIIKSKINLDDFNSRFEEYFKHKDPSHDNLHKQLVKVKFKGFVTTNYDPIIEAALRSVQGKPNYVLISPTTKKDIHQFIKSLSSNNWYERYHLYLHGRYNYPSTSILSYGDYMSQYDGIPIQEIPFYEDLIDGRIDIEAFEAKNQLKQRALRTLHYKTIYLIMATQRVVYFGYGLRDPYLIKIVNDLQSDFHPEYDDFHYTLVSSNNAKNWTLKDYERHKEKWILKGIEIVFYEDNDTNTGIEDFVKGLSPDSFIPLPVEPHHDIKGVEQEPEEKIMKTKEEDEAVNEKLKSKMLKTIEELKRK